MPRMTIIAALLVLAGVCAIYVPDIGHGFVRDDVGWINHGRSAWKDPTILFKAPSGQFRPAMSASFTLESAVCGVNAFCYGLTNFWLFLACSLAVIALGRALSLSFEAALLAAAIWIFNWHGINAAVLWISGRTALLLVLSTTLSATAFLKGRWITAASFAAIAMLSKEEGVVLPATLLAWAAVEAWDGERPLLSSRNLGFAAASLAMACAYYLLHGHSGALTPSTAPAFYRPDVSVSRVMWNGPEYLDRSATFAMALLSLWWIVDGWPLGVAIHTNRKRLAFAAVWWIGGFAITMFLPVRSSLYACVPSVGVAIATAGILSEAWTHINSAQRQRALRAGLAIPFLLWPVYHARNRGSSTAAELSARTMMALQGVAVEKGPGAVVVLKDDREHRPSFDSVFGNGVQEVVSFTVRPPVSVWIDPPPADAALGGLSGVPQRVDATLRLIDGRVERLR